MAELSAKIPRRPTAQRLALGGGSQPEACPIRYEDDKFCFLGNAPIRAPLRHWNMTRTPSSACRFSIAIAPDVNQPQTSLSIAVRVMPTTPREL